MRRALKFVVPMILGLAALTWFGSFVVHKTTTAWFEKDMSLRAELVINGARQAIVGSWAGEHGRALQKLLSDITHDERIMAGAVCSADLVLLTHTRDFPDRFRCSDFAGSLGKSSSAEWTPSHGEQHLPDGSVYVSAVPVRADGRMLGFVVLVHDLSYVERREGKTRFFLLVAFGLLALTASAVTLLAARFFWRGWSNELRRSLQDGRPSPEFKPILRDVQDLVTRLVAESDLDNKGKLWSADSLRQTLRRTLHGERVLVLANRQPYIHERNEQGEVRVVHPASGLVTSLEPIMRACSGTWVAHGSGSADRDSTDRHARIRVPPGEESYTVRRVWLNDEEEQGYYYGFANEGLWPLCHIAHNRPVFRQEDFRHYQAVNAKFVNALCEEVDTDDPVILVQDYHFALTPRLIRERLPRATVIMFWHIPWPNSQRFGICPWREELLDGMLGSCILGFQTQFDCGNFVDTVERFLETRVDREQTAIVQRGHNTLVRSYPISLDWPVKWLEQVPSVDECRTRVFAELGLAKNAFLGVGIDRLDYTKGIEERLLAVERLLERFASLRGRFTFAQLAAPSRTSIERYQRLNDDVERLAARINQRFGNGDYQPVVLLRAHHEPPTVFTYYRAADLCYVSSLHDGMNLVAKEFVAARDDEHGVLVLSQFTGAARELTEALLVNPYDLEQASAAMAAALHMSRAEQRERLRSMRTFISEFNVYRWAGRMLNDAARLRSRERLTSQLTEPIVARASGAGL